MSGHKRIPLMYYPTNVAVLDDESRFLDFMRQVINYPTPYVTETDPHQLLSYLSTHTHKPDTLSSLITQANFDVHASDLADTKEHFDIDFLRLQGKLSQADRYKKINIVFVDQILKKPITGLEFCQKVREAGIMVKLVLLTGQAGLDEAVEAFNAGIIDAYLPKSKEFDNQGSLEKAINQAVEKYTWQQFVELGSTLSGFLSHIMKPLSDEKYIEVLEKILREHKIVEFYVLDSSCSFLLFDEKGNAKQLLMRNEEDFNDAYAIAKDSEAPYDVLQAIRGRQKFPVTKQRQGYLSLVSDAWEDVMEFVKKVPGRDGYYAIVDRPDIENFSFHQYINTEWPKP